MHFFIRIEKSQENSKNSFKLVEIDTDDKYLPPNQFIIIGNNGRIKLHEFNMENKVLWIYGDPVFHQRNMDFYKDLFDAGIWGKLIREMDGFYYLIVWDKIEHKLTVATSLLNILPIYYIDNNNELIISSSFELVHDNTNSSSTIDNQYYLEKAIFNYALFNRTPINEIKTVPSNYIIEYNGKLRFIKHTAIVDYFVKNPLPWRKSLESLSDIFIKQATSFLPEEKFYATFTGGFDGRTVIGLAKSLGLDFATFSYGSATDSDVTVPARISKKLGIPYSSIMLNSDFAIEHWWDNANLFLQKSFGTGNFSRSQYYYTLSTLLNDTKYLLSGNFGSEIIRAMKVPGVMTSEILFNVFKLSPKISLKEKILNYPGIKYLSRELVNNNIDGIILEIESFLSNLSPELSTNQKFYVYLYEEVFRKYFGPEIMVQRQFLNHRAPFLSFRFIEELLKTEIAGANSAFQETNPLMRYRGQVLYAHILRKTYPPLLFEKLDRNYKPIDFLKSTGVLNIAKGYLIKNYIKKHDKNTPSYSTICIHSNLPKIEALFVDEHIFNHIYLNNQLKGAWKKDQMHFVNAISAISYNNRLNNS